MNVSICTFVHLYTFSWTAVTGLIQIRFSSYTQEHIYQTPDSRAPLDSQYTEGEMLKSKILIILDIGHSKGALCQNNESYFSSGN